MQTVAGGIRLPYRLRTSVKLNTDSTGPKISSRAIVMPLST
jgi:hypothetical protein